MESRNTHYMPKKRLEYKKFNFENASIMISEYENYFLYADFENKQRCNIPLDVFKFVDTTEELKECYFKLKNGKIDHEEFNKWAPECLFKPLTSFVATDKVIHIQPHFVYVIRSYLSPVAKAVQKENEKVERGCVYKFDFKTFKTSLVFVFNTDLYQFSCERFHIRLTQNLELELVYTKRPVLVNNKNGILIFGGKGNNLVTKNSNSLMADCYYLLVDETGSEKLDLMYRMTKPLRYPVANPSSTLVSTKYSDYVVLNGGYETPQTGKDIGKPTGNKLDRKYQSIHNFSTIYFDCDRSQIYNQEFINDPSGKSWNVKNSLVISHEDHIYILGGCPMLENIDLNYEKFLCLKYQISFNYMEVSSVEPKLDANLK